MNYQQIDNLPQQYAVIDMDTGTVLGTNLRLVLMPEDLEAAEAILSSDSEAWAYANRNGLPLYRPEEN